MPEPTVSHTPGIEAPAMLLPWRNDRVALGCALAAFALHALCAGRYDLFRDELYFIVCGRHPAFGYADQPPLVPLLAAAFYAPGHSLWLLRLPATLAAGGLAWLVVRFARLLGGGQGAGVIAAGAVTIAPMLMGIAATLNTTALDPLAWTALAWALAQAIRTGDRRMLLVCGVIAGIDLQAKYALVQWGAGLAAGLLLTPARRLIGSWQLWCGAAIAALIAAPSLLWQAGHGFPFAELAAAARGKNADVAPIAFVWNQILVMNPLLAPLWLAGLIAPFVAAPLRPYRFVPIAFAVCAAMVIAAHGKDYYLAACYPALFTIGAVAIERWAASRRAMAIAWAMGALAVSAAIAPLVLPALPVPLLKSYVAALPIRPQQQEKSFAGTLLPQEFADQLGWRDFTAQVGAAWAKIPPAERARTAIKVDNYGEAAALEVLAPPGELPPPLSGHNQYFEWGPRGQDPVNLLVVQHQPEELAPYCRRVTVFGVTASADAMAYENGKAIAYCQGLHPAIKVIWPELKNFS